MKKEKIDCLFIHMPNLSNFYLPEGEFANTNYIAMGVIALANLVQSKGYRAKIIHMGVERVADPSYSLIDYLKTVEVKVIGFSLFWYHQSYDVLEMAKKVKEKYPDIFIYLGGLTASYFAEEILKSFSCIDAVMKGYGEKAVLQLLDNNNMANICNITYKCNGNIISNPIEEIDRNLFDELDYATLDLLSNKEIYVKYFGLHEMPPLVKDIDKLQVDPYWQMFPLAIGRGCSMVCSYCGGNKNVWNKESGSNKLFYRKPDNIINDIKRAIHYGYKKFFICFDPDCDQSFYINLFDRISKEKLDISMYFECWGLPTEKFLLAFSKTFKDDASHILLSVDSYDEKVRNMHKGQKFSNTELNSRLDFIDKCHIKFDICFCIGLPGGSIEEARFTKSFMYSIAKKYKTLGRTITLLVDLIPGSCLFEHPEKYNIKVGRKSFMDIYEDFSKPRNPTNVLCNYKVNNYFGDERDKGTIEAFAKELYKLKCQEFCFVGGYADNGMSPEYSREQCLKQRINVYKKLGIDKVPRMINESYTYVDALKDFEIDYKSSIRWEYK